MPFGDTFAKSGSFEELVSLMRQTFQETLKKLRTAKLLCLLRKNSIQKSPFHQQTLQLIMQYDLGLQSSHFSLAFQNKKFHQK